MRTIEFEFNDKVYHLCFNGAALFDCYDKFGAKGEVTSHITPPTRKGFNNTCWMLAKLSEQGEAVRRYMGLEPQKPLNEMCCQLMLKPIDVLDVKGKIVDAISLGFTRTEDEGTYDPWLAELEQKKTVKPQGQNTSTRRRRFSGFLRKK